MTAHWTETSPQKFAYRVASDFVEQVRLAMKAKGWSQNKFAKKLGLTPGRVSQILNNPGNLTLETMALWSRKLGGKVVVSYYEDGDSRNQRGPINGEVFRQCWVKAGMPINTWSLQESTQSAQAIPSVAVDECVYQVPKGHHGGRHIGKRLIARGASGVAAIGSFGVSEGKFLSEDKATLRELMAKANVPS